MSFLDLYKKRRSVRRFLPDPVKREDLVTIVDAGRMAASGCNRQPWSFIIIDDKNQIEGYKQIFGDGWLVKAPAMIAVVMEDKASEYWLEDGSAAIENIMLAATELGYGSCWVEGQVKPHEKMMKKLLNVPDELTLLAIIPIGKTDKWPDAPGKKPLEDVLYIGEYGRKA